MNPEFTRYQKLPLVSDPAETDQPLQPSTTTREVPQGLGLRQSSAAFEVSPLVRKRQRTAALQDADAHTTVITPSRA